MTIPRIAAPSILLAFALVASTRAEWEFHAAPGPGNLGNILYGVDGVADDDVWAVGRADFGPGYPEPPDIYETFAIHWDGAQWTLFPTPSPGSYWNDLVEVVAFASNDVWAVGSGTSAIQDQVLVLHFQGETWDIVPTPVFEGGAAAWTMGGVSSDDLWVVGQGGGQGPLALRWDGSSWEHVATPEGGDYINALYGVHAVTPDDVWAVGRYRNVGETSHFMIQHFNGTGWAIDVASFTLLPASHSALRGVAVVAADDVWAVGDHYVSGEGTQPLIMHYDGSGWSVHPLRPFPDGAAELRDVTAAGPDDVWAAGTHATDEGVPRPLIMHWNGIEWLVVESIATGGSHEWFRDIAAIPGGDVWAVGQYSDGDGTTSLTMQLPGAAPVPGDIDGDGVVGTADLLALLGAWGPCDGCPEDVDGDGAVGTADLLALLSNWGPAG